MLPVSRVPGASWPMHACRPSQGDRSLTQAAFSLLNTTRLSRTPQKASDLQNPELFLAYSPSYTYALTAHILSLTILDLRPSSASCTRLSYHYHAMPFASCTPLSHHHHAMPSASFLLLSLHHHANFMLQKPL